MACGDDEPAAAPPDDVREDGGPSPIPPDPPAADAGADADRAPPFTAYDLNHVLGTGQSLSVGAASGGAISAMQPYGNQMFSKGTIPGGTGLTAFANLVEGTNETMSSGFANLSAELAGAVFGAGTKHDVLISVHGVGGIAYAGLKKGSEPFANGMAQVTAAAALAKELGKSYVVRAVTNVHGESDHLQGNGSYDKDLAEWQGDYERDVRAITGQAEPVPMLHTQMSSWTRYNSATSAIPFAQLKATLDSDGKIVLVGPKYHLPYSDGVHLTAEGYRHMGEDYAKVYRRVILERRPWEPLRPVQVTRAGAVLTIRFAVPKPPLVLDTDLVSDPGSMGFEFAQTGAAAPAITSVALAGPDTVTVTLASAPTGTEQRIRYAFTGTSGSNAGATTGPRGNLRDSDDTPSRHGYKLYNWCVHFNEAVP